MDTTDIYTYDQMVALAVLLFKRGGEAIRQEFSPVKDRWGGLCCQAVLQGDKTRSNELGAFRSDDITYLNP